jgi:hypothetical protein
MMVIEAGKHVKVDSEFVKLLCRSNGNSARIFNYFLIVKLEVNSLMIKGTRKRLVFAKKCRISDRPAYGFKGPF